VLDDDEAAAIAVGLIGAVHSPVSGSADASVRALAKLVQVMPARLRQRVEALAKVTDPAVWRPAGDLVDAGTLATVAQACRDAERLEMAYRTGGGTTGGRRVEPHRLVALGMRWYLVAYDNDRSDWRTFRLDRIGSVQPTGTRFGHRPIPTGDAATFVRNRITQLPRPVRVVADVSAPGAEVRRRIGRWCQVEDGTAGTCTVRIGTESPEWAAFALLLCEHPFTLREPLVFADLLTRWRDRLDAATAAVEPAQGT
jgi:predicted DNA-binding transcriptional regulator YafY